MIVSKSSTQREKLIYSSFKEPDRIAKQKVKVRVLLVKPFPPLVFPRPTVVIAVLTKSLLTGGEFLTPGVQPQVRIWAETQETKVPSWIQEIGIPSQNREPIFGVFERQQRVETDPGTGIGQSDRCGVPGRAGKLLLNEPKKYI